MSASIRATTEDVSTNQTANEGGTAWMDVTPVRRESPRFKTKKKKATPTVGKDGIMGGVPWVNDIEVKPKYISGDIGVNTKSALEGKTIRIRDPRSSHSTILCTVARVGEGSRNARVSFMKSRMSYGQVAKRER
jgi:hypothetical protein